MMARALVRGRRSVGAAALTMLVLAAAVAPCSARAQPSEASCGANEGAPVASRDLYCVSLLAPPGLEGLRGAMELTHIPGPFTVAVTRDGHLRYRPVLRTAGLPPASSLGPYRRYVAWAATPDMAEIVRLGNVAAGNTVATLADLALEKFLILISAEANGDGAAPAGRIVLRGQSPSTRLQPPDFLEFAIGSMREPASSAAPPPDSAPHGAHHAHVAPGTAATRDRWPEHPMHPSVQMLPAEMALRPAVGPYLPESSDTSAVPVVRASQVVRLAHGDTLQLEAGLVRRTWKGRDFIMYGFNGQQPGPLLWVPQGAEIVVLYRNALDQPSTVHWHGIRLENRFDGVPGSTQPAVPPGGRFTYRVRFPDAGIYWYHPHVREDLQQDLGLAGNLMVRSPRADFFGAAHREEILLLDDLLVGDDGLVPWGAEATTHALMGRFGNVFLVNGEPAWRGTASVGEVVRYYLTNASNTRTFNLSFGAGTRMKVVGGDLGPYEREEWVESVVLAPAERYVVHVRFDRGGDVALVNRVRGLDHLFGRFFQEEDTLGVVHVRPEQQLAPLGSDFDALREDTATTTALAAFRAWRERPVDRELVLTMRTRNLPFITRTLMELDSIYFAPVEWSGTMPHMNWASTGAQIEWIVRDPRSGRENAAIDDWQFGVGDVVKLRLINDRTTAHAMQHPIHIHGQRFLVLSVNGVPQTNVAWKDTVLLPVGTVVELVVEMSNPGRWMLHCHIAEHLSANMMMEFQVR